MQEFKAATRVFIDAMNRLQGQHPPGHADPGWRAQGFAAVEDACEACHRNSAPLRPDRALYAVPGRREGRANERWRSSAVAAALGGTWCPAAARMADNTMGVIRLAWEARA